MGITGSTGPCAAVHGITTTAMSVFARKYVSCGTGSKELCAPHIPVISSSSQRVQHAGAGTASQGNQRHIPEKSESLCPALTAMGEFDLVDVEVDDVEMLSEGVCVESTPRGGFLEKNDDLIQVLLKAKALPKPRHWMFINYTVEEIATWRPECYKNEINFER